MRELPSAPPQPATSIRVDFDLNAAEPGEKPLAHVRIEQAGANGDKQSFVCTPDTAFALGTAVRPVALALGEQPNAEYRTVLDDERLIVARTGLRPADTARVKANVEKMRELAAPEPDVLAYLKSEDARYTAVQLLLLRSEDAATVEWRITIPRDLAAAFAERLIEHARLCWHVTVWAEAWVDSAGGVAPHPQLSQTAIAEKVSKLVLDHVALAGRLPVS